MSTVPTSVPPPATGPGRPRIWSRLYRGETAFNFIGRRRIWFAISTVVILIGLVSLATRGLNFGIDFKGGTSWQVPTRTVSVAQARSAVGSLGVAEATVETLGSGANRTLEVQADLARLGSRAHQAHLQQEVSAKLAGLAHVAPSDVSINDVGPTWGSNITNKALEALVAFFLGISLYITLRFEWKMAVAAIAAVVHDILVTVGIYSLSGFQVTPATVVAFLTILGYSLYDTIVVFDRVQENTRGGMGTSGKLTYSDTVNLSMNQVLMRSINTSLVAILPILSVLVIGAEVLGATTLREFGLALFIGLTTGAYSSIFVASPLLAILKEREPRYVAIRQRLEARGDALTLLTPAAAALAGASQGGDRATAGTRAGTGTRPGSRSGAPKSKVATRPAASRPGSRPGGGPVPKPTRGGARPGRPASSGAQGGNGAAPRTAGEGGGAATQEVGRDTGFGDPPETVLLRPGGASQAGSTNGPPGPNGPPGADGMAGQSGAASSAAPMAAPEPNHGVGGNGPGAGDGAGGGSARPAGAQAPRPSGQVRRPPPRSRKKGKRRH